MPRIASSATVEARAELAPTVDVGPGCYIGPDVQIGEGTRLIANVTILGNTRIGAGNIFYPGSVMGAAPQDLKYKGGRTQLVIGDNNIFRECVTAHTGTEVAGGLTQVGDHNQFQVGTHLAHDVHVGDHCILSNQVQVAGHVHIENHVTISGLVGIQQFVTIGQYCFITGAARCTMDTPPYVIFGYDGAIQGVNVKGLGRWGFGENVIQRLRDLCKKLFPKKGQSPNRYGLRSLYALWPGRRDDRAVALTLAHRIQEAESSGPWDEHCQYLLSFLKRSVTQGIHGRYLESLRRDAGNARPAFYAGSGAL